MHFPPHQYRAALATIPAGVAHFLVYDLCMWCTHSNLTEAVEGQSLCLDCGLPIETAFTGQMFDRAVELIYRDHGWAGRHSMSCVETTDGEWCCAEDCTLKVKR